MKISTYVFTVLKNIDFERTINPRSPSLSHWVFATDRRVVQCRYQNANRKWCLQDHAESGYCVTSVRTFFSQKNYCLTMVTV